jgi:predicted nucleotidyltransferase component of viral defense system
MNKVVEQMLQRVPEGGIAVGNLALREVMQEIALAGLYRRGFFGKAAFYGGTCLRIFQQLPRFSEDLDFSLLQSDPEFCLEPYLQGVEEEFAALGIGVEIKVKSKTAPSAIISAFLKPTTTIIQLAVSGPKALKIKLEVDTDPPLGFNTEEQLLLQPYSLYVKCFSLPDLFAGKMHAVLFRQWQQRVKGRDWFDLEWYVRRGIPLHLDHLAERSRQSGHWPIDQTFTAHTLQRLLADRINSLDVSQARVDIERFISDPQLLEIWSQEYFTQIGQSITTVGSS